MRCPIILGVEGEAREVLEEANAGIAITPEDAGALAAAMRCLADDPERAAGYGQLRARLRRRAFRSRRSRHAISAIPRGRCRSATDSRNEARRCRAAGDRMRDPIRHLRRSIAFARHVPPRQALRRIALSARRAWRDKLGAHIARVDAAPAPDPPTPIFGPRSGMIESTPRGLVFTFLGRAVKMAPSSIDWDAPSRDPEHQLWRMHLHYMEYLEEVDDALLAALIEDWIAANPSTRAGAWKDSWNAYALSLRVVVWMQQLALRGGRISQSTRAMAVASLAAQLAFLESELETDLGGNHLVKNIKALLWASAFFCGADAQRWRRVGLRLLSVALEGRSFPTAYISSARPPTMPKSSLISWNAATLLDPKTLRLRSTIGFARWRRRPPISPIPTALVAQFNDAGLTWPTRRATASTPSVSCWASVRAPRTSFAFPEAGYFGRRAGDTFFIADCGRIGPDALPAHAHGDVSVLRVVGRGRAHRSSIPASTNISTARAGARRAPPPRITRCASTASIRPSSLAPSAAAGGPT